MDVYKLYKQGKIFVYQLCKLNKENMFWYGGGRKGGILENKTCFCCFVSVALLLSFINTGSSQSVLYDNIQYKLRMEKEFGFSYYREL